MRDTSALVERIWPDRESVAGLARRVVLVLGGSVLLALSAKVQIPFWPVPLNMETFVLLVIGLGYGRALGLATVLAFLVEGALGFPVFANGAGPAYFLGPTGGYLIGYIPAILLLGWLADRDWDRRLELAILAALLADAIVFVFGVAWLATLVGLSKALHGGLYPFVLGDALKVVGAALAVWGVGRLATRMSPPRTE